MNGKNKKVIAGTVALSMALSGAAYAAVDADNVSGQVAKAGAGAVAFLNGDVNQDGEVTLADAQLALKGALKIKTDFTKEEMYAADVNSDGQLVLSDAQMILKAALKIEGLPEKAAPVTSDAPSGTTTPDVTPTPSDTETPADTDAPAGSEAPSATKPAGRPTPPPVAESDAPVVRPEEPKAPTLEAVEPADYVVTGVAVQMLDANGATEENGIYTFTDDNKAAMSGIEFEWPYANRTDLRQTVEEAGVTKSSILALSDAYLSKNGLEKILEETGTIDYSVYPRPQWTNGVSVSFWSKQQWTTGTKSNVDPLLVIKRSYFCDYCYENNIDPGNGGAIKHHVKRDDCDFGLVVYANGSVSFSAGDEAKNAFRAGSNYADKDNEWTHYTITIANDFITVYVNGQEMVYQSINLDKDASSESFNDGFMTRYNPIGIVTQEMLDNDVRGYLTAPTVGSSKESAYLERDGVFQTNWEATILGNGRYKEGYTSKYMLLMDLLTENNVKMYLGGRPKGDVCCVQSSTTGYAEYNTPTGSQVSGVMCYEKELKADEVAAVYEASKTEYKDILGLE